MSSMASVASMGDFRETARGRLPRFLFDYADGGALDEQTLRHNESDLQKIMIRQRVLQDVASLDLSTSWFGRCRPMPVALGPIGIAGMFRRRGEVQAARAAERHGVPFTLSTVGICSISELRAAVPAAPLWFQLYVIRDRGFMRELLAVAREKRVEALVFTVDMPVPGIRRRDVRSGMSGQRGPMWRLLQAAGKPAWAWDVGVRGRPHQLGNLSPVLGENSGMDDYIAWMARNFDPGIRWKDLHWLREAWDGPLIVKGILDAEDARAAADYGAEAIIVSNHGGRQLDGVPSVARALPAIVQAVGERVTLFADGGVRSGLDVLRMLALGANGVLLGRAWLWALAAGGSAGVDRMLSMFRRELEVVMTLAGCSSITAIDRSVLVQDPFASPERN
jgi:L-lactate dehydrogenase (cytochrome)